MHHRIIAYSHEYHSVICDVLRVHEGVKNIGGDRGRRNLLTVLAKDICEEAREGLNFYLVQEWVEHGLRMSLDDVNEKENSQGRGTAAARSSIPKTPKSHPTKKDPTMKGAAFPTPTPTKKATSFVTPGKGQKAASAKASVNDPHVDLFDLSKTEATPLKLMALKAAGYKSFEEEQENFAVSIASQLEKSYDYQEKENEANHRRNKEILEASIASSASGLREISKKKHRFTSSLIMACPDDDTL